MPFVAQRLVTVIAERTVRDRLLSAIHRLGATGHTISNVQGEGTRGMSSAGWTGQNVKIEAVVTPDVADAIVTYVAETFFEHHSVIVYLQNVDVVRGSKYAPHNDAT